MSPDNHVNPNVTVSELEDAFEDVEFNYAKGEDKDHYLCDWCSKGVPIQSEPRVSQYLADRVVNETHPKSSMVNRQRKVTQLATYCPECSHSFLFFPCTGFAEARLQFSLTENGSMTEVEVTDVSPRDDGVPWNPVEISESITQVPFEQNAIAADDIYGPENFVTIFQSYLETTEIRSIVKHDGSLDPKELGRARKEYDEFRSKMRQEGYSRGAFSSHVREKR